MSITTPPSRLRSSRRHPGRRAFLLALLAGLILAWCNGAFGRAPFATLTLASVVQPFGEYLSDVNSPSAATIRAPASPSAQLSANS